MGGSFSLLGTAPGATGVSPNGLLHLPMYGSKLKGINSTILACTEVEQRDATGAILNANPGDNYWDLVGVGAAETKNDKNLANLYVGSLPHAVMVNARLDFWRIAQGVSFYNLNDPTLVKGLGTTVLTNAVAVNKAGYVLCNTATKPVLLVPLTY